MLTFDAFGFTQIFIVFWILLGLSASLLVMREPKLAAEAAPPAKPVRRLRSQPSPLAP